MALGHTRNLLCAAWLAAMPAPAAESAATPAPAEALRMEVLRADADLFDAFNRADLAGVARMFAPDLEFYQDDEGLASHDRTLDDLRQMFAQAGGIHRELDAESVEVRPIKGYGAMELGTHRFCHREEGKEICGDFRFVHVWRNAGGKWQLARVISYGHKIEE